MTFKRHIRLFLGNHLWVIILFVCSAIFLTVLLLINKEASVDDVLYYNTLPLVLLIIFLFYRCYATWNYYDLILKEPTSIDDYILSELKSYEERDLQKVLKKIRSLYITEMIKKEEERKKHRSMIYQWVHQLKTPLSVIDLITQNHTDEEDYIKINQSIKEMRYDLDQLLAMYRLEQLENDFIVENICLIEVVKNCINQLKISFIENEIYPKMEIDAEILVYTDKRWIQFVLYQLFTNAIKYSDHKSTLFISVKKVGGQVKLSVEDTGCGILKEDINRIFELFYTGQNGRLKGESTGIGLYMVKYILDFLGHSIQVESTLNKGSIFTITF